MHLSRVPKGLEPDKSEVPYNVCMSLIKFYTQKLALETKRRKVNLFEQKEFLFLQATPAYKPPQSREGSPSFRWQTLIDSVPTRVVHSQDKRCALPGRET